MKNLACLISRCPGAITAFLAVAIAAHGQSIGGSLRGVVQDATSARIVSASVQVQATGHSLARTAQSDDHGYFRMDDLVPGSYSVRVKSPGFSEAAASVIILVSSIQDIAVTLRPESVKQTVGIDAQSSSITTQALDLASAVHQSVITSQDLTTLPMAARSFSRVFRLTRHHRFSPSA